MIDNENIISPSRVEIAFRIAAIDDLIGAQLNEILHHPAFKELEATWRGLHYLVSESLPSQRVKIKILNAAKRDLLKNFERASEFNQSEIFKRVYDEVYYVIGESPFGMLIGVYEFGKYPQDIALLEHISRVAAIAHAPFISAVSPDMFGWNHFSEMYNQRDLTKIFDSSEYIYWRAFRELEDSRYIGLCLPHILLRDPHNFERSFKFQESTGQKDLLWSNAAFAFGACAARAFNEKSWLGVMNGFESDGLVEGLYFQTFHNSDGAKDYQTSLDVMIKPDKEFDLSNLGFIPLVEYSFMSQPAFFSNQSANKPKIYDTEQANSTARAFGQLSNIFAVSRFAHYLMTIARDRFKPFSGKEECQRELNNWISRYVRNNVNESQAQYPLSEVFIKVEELPDRPDKFKAIVFLRPIYQLDELLIAMRMVVNLP